MVFFLSHAPFITKSMMSYLCRDDAGDAERGVEEYLHDRGRAARDHQAPGDGQRGENTEYRILILSRVKFEFMYYAIVITILKALLGTI